MAPESPQIIIITGISGAGKSSVLRCFEDMGFFTVDNLPPPLMDKFIEVFYSSGSDIKGVALVMDVRGRAFFTDTINVLETLKKNHSDGIKGIKIGFNSPGIAPLCRYKFIFASIVHLLGLRNYHYIIRAGKIYSKNRKT